MSLFVNLRIKPRLMNSLHTIIVSLLFLTLIACNSAEHQKSPEPNNEVNYSDLELTGDQMNPIAYYDGEPFTGWAVVYTGGNVRFTEQQYVEGKKEGGWRVYFTNGQLQKEGFSIGGVEHGEYLEWYANGNLKYEYQYEQGKKVGKWLSWYEDGTPYTERNFVNDQIHGKVFVWDEQGELAKEYDYLNNRQMNAIMHFEKNNSSSK